MKVKVVVYGDLRKHLADSELGKVHEVDVPSGTTVAELCEILGIPGEEVKQAVVNARRREFRDPLDEGDRVAVFPPIAGG